MMILLTLTMKCYKISKVVYKRRNGVLGMKRIVSIQDISCFGKCSLTVALPIISAMGIEACPVPTAVLSTHTGGFYRLYISRFNERYSVYRRPLEKP